MTEQEWLVSKDPRAMLKDTIVTRRRGYTTPQVKGNLLIREISDHKLRMFCGVIAALTGIQDSARMLFDEEAYLAEREDWVDNAYEWILHSKDCLGKNPIADQKSIADALRDLVGNPFHPPVLFDPSWRTEDVRNMALSAYEPGNQPSIGRLDPQRLLVLSDALEDAGCPTHVEESVACSECKEKGVVEYCACFMYDCGEFSAKCSRPSTKNCAACGGRGRIAIKQQPHPLLDHLRSPETHWLGCWAIDLILERMC